MTTTRIVSLAAGLCVAAAPPVAAQDGDGGDSAYSLGGVVVTGTPVETRPSDAPADIDVLSGAEKDRRQATSLGESLDHLGGVDSIGAGPQVGKPVLRGFSGNRVRVLSDGIGLDHQQFGVRHPPNVDPFAAERIEVVRGAQSLLYGSGALGGAVNVLPSRPPSTTPGNTTASGRTLLEYQTGYDQITGAAKAEAAYGPFGIAANFTGRDSGGLETPPGDEALDSGDPSDPLVTGDVPFTDYRQFNGDLNLGYMTDWGQVSLRYAAYRDQHNFVVPDPPNQPTESGLVPGGVGQTLENDLVQLKADLDVTPTWTVQPKVAFSSNLRVSNPGPPDPQPREFLPGAKAIDIRRNNWTGRLVGEHGPLVAGLRGRVGMEVVRVDQESRGRVPLTPGGDVWNVAAFAFEERQFGDLTLTGGVRLDYRRVEADPDKTQNTSGLAGANSLTNTYVTPTASLGASYRVTDRLSIASNVARGFRAPNLFELYANGRHGGVAAFQRGDSSLDPETSISADAQIRWQSDWLTAKATGYVNEISDFIFLAGTGTTVPGGNLPIFQVSQQDARIYGADLTLDATPRPWLNLRGTLGYVDGELDDGRQVPLLPPLKLGGEVTFQQKRVGVFRDAALTFGVRYADSQQSAGLIEPFGQFDSPPPPFGTGSTDSYTLFDINLGARIAKTGTRLDVGVQNLFDTEHRDFLDTYKNITLGPGRNVTLRLTQPF